MPEPAIRLTLPDRQAALLGGLFTVIGGCVCLVLALDWPFIARGDLILVCLPAALGLAALGIGVSLLFRGATSAFETDPVRRVVRHERRQPWGTRVREHRYDDICEILLEKDDESRSPRYCFSIVRDDVAEYARDTPLMVAPDEAREIEERLAAEIGCSCYDSRFALQPPPGGMIACCVMFFASQGFPLIFLIWAYVPIIVRKLTNQAPPTHLLALCGVVGMSLLALCALALIPLWMYRSHVETDRRRGILRVRRVRPWRLVTRTYPYDTIDAVTVETHAPPNRAPTYGVSILLHDGRPIATGYRSRDPGKASETATRLARRIGCPCTDATA